MLFTRWKLMTGALGLSLGGLATFGGQTPPAASPLMVRSDEPSNLPPPPSVPVATLPSVQPLPLPSTPTAVAVDPVLPALPAAPAGIDLPSLPVPDSKPVETKVPASPKPTKPMDTPVLPVSGITLPSAPPSVTAPVLPSTPPLSTKPVAVAPMEPPPPLPEFSVSPVPTKPVAITPVETPLPVVEYTKPVPTKVVAAAATVPSRFRIVLRVGAGDPAFEVRHDDDLVMKVVCEKVDIKSPEKGQGPSSVTATGKVRFVGFGAEGTCDSFSFLSGTGEVALSGNVNVKVRDKIGRVESELNADKMQYKLDQTALGGVLKP